MNSATDEIASHAACGPQPQGRGPVHPFVSENTLSTFIKFRLTTSEKSLIEKVAADADLTVSAMLRRVGRAVVAGRIPSRNILADLVEMRRAANALAVLAENPDANAAEIAEAVKVVAKKIHAIASQHLATIR
jgi:hypothetical protein